MIATAGNFTQQQTTHPPTAPLGSEVGHPPSPQTNFWTSYRQITFQQHQWQLSMFSSIHSCVCWNSAKTKRLLRLLPTLFFRTLQITTLPHDAKDVRRCVQTGTDLLGCFATFDVINLFNCFLKMEWTRGGLKDSTTQPHLVLHRTAQVLPSCFWRVFFPQHLLGLQTHWQTRHPRWHVSPQCKSPPGDFYTM